MGEDVWREGTRLSEADILSPHFMYTETQSGNRKGQTKTNSLSFHSVECKYSCSSKWYDEPIFMDIRTQEQSVENKFCFFSAAYEITALYGALFC